MSEHQRVKQIPKELMDMKNWVSTFNKKPNTSIHYELFNYNTRKNPGFVFTMAHDVCGIDIDDCITFDDKSQHKKTDEVVIAWAEKLKTYTEISGSGTGLHILFKADKTLIEKFLGGKKGVRRKIAGIGYEFYIADRQFVLTGDSHPKYQEIREINFEELEDFLNFIVKRPEKKVVEGVAPKLPDDKIIEIIKRSKQKGKFLDFWEREGIKGNSDGDIGLAGILAFYTQDEEQIVRIMRGAPCYRSKFDRDNYLYPIAKKAIENRTGTYKPKSLGEKAKEAEYSSEIEWDKDFEKKGYPILSMSNLRILLDHYGMTLSYNEMSHEIELDGLPIENRHDVIVKDLCTKHKFIGATVNIVCQYINALALENQFHPVRNYFDTLDQVSGNSEFSKLVDTLTLSNEDDKEYASMLIKKWMVSCIAAIYDPDFRAQGALTFQSIGGRYKSTWFKNLIPEKVWFRDEFVGLDVNNRDSVQKAIKYWVTELAELESTLKKDFISLKGFITSSSDEYRAAYERRIESHNRQTVFCASVNSIEFLKDDTGDRRFWVIELEDIDIKAQGKIDFDKLWGEILFAYRNGETYWPDRQQTDMIMAKNRGYSIKSDLDDYLASLVRDSVEPSNMTVVDMLGIVKEYSDIKDATTSKVGRALSKLGFQSKVTKINGIPTRVYKVNMIRPRKPSSFFD